MIKMVKTMIIKIVNKNVTGTKYQKKRGLLMKKLIVILAALAVVLTAPSAMAATDTNPLAASASVAATCTIQSVTDLDFGTYDTSSATDDDDGVGNVVFRCTKGTGYDVYITGARTMTDGTDTLNFEMYQEVGRTTLWPSASVGVTGTAANNGNITLDIFGRITALQDVQVGAYVGSVTVTVEY